MLVNRTVGKLREWLSHFPDDAKIFFETSVYEDDALIYVEVPGNPVKYHNTNEIEGFHEKDIYAHTI